MQDRGTVVRKLIHLGQVILVEQENSDFLARYGLSQDYKLRYSPPPLSDPWPLPQVFEETGRLYAINPNQLEWNIMGKGAQCPTLSQIVDRFKAETLFVSAGVLAADDAVLDPGFLFMPNASTSSDNSKQTTDQDKVHIYNSFHRAVYFKHYFICKKKRTILLNYCLLFVVILSLFLSLSFSRQCQTKQKTTEVKSLILGFLTKR